MSKTKYIEETFHEDWRIRLQVHEMLHEVKTKHQHLAIFKNNTWGTVLVLDGVIQLTTSDEFIYHEMMAHVPLMSLERPSRVLVVGGGDGGVLREVLKHGSVKKATLCEIDRSVIDLSLKHYPEISDGAFDHARAEVVIADGLKYVADTKERFDAIIVDSSEPIGPSAVLHSAAFFADCKRALKDGGILVTQNGLPNLCQPEVVSTTSIFAGLFKHPAPYLCTQPCYFGGPFLLNAASDGDAMTTTPVATLKRRVTSRKISTRYYTPELHPASFVIPRYIQDVIDEGLHAGRKGPGQKASGKKAGGKRAASGKAKKAAKR
ncbi:MAG: polyamine aminopropyltransferase [Pseudomonadota bacterium]